MKILMVSEDIPSPQLGGLARHVVVLANALREAGHEVALMGRPQPRYEDCAEEVGFSGRFIPGIQGLETGWKEVATGCFIPLKRDYMSWCIARAIRRVAGEFDVVHYHGHYPMVNLFLGRDQPFVQTRHDQGSECVTHMRLRGQEVCKELSPEACAGCAHPDPGAIRTGISALAVRRYRRQAASAFERHPVIFVSDFLRRQFRHAVPIADLSRSHVIHAFIDEAAISVSDAEVPAGKTIIHVAGRLAPTKGIVEFVRLLQPRLRPDWEVHVYGDGPQRNELEAMLGPQVLWHGHRSTAEVMLACRRATAAVVPSVWEEPWGAVTAEALRFGVPCYALAQGGTPELARYGAKDLLRLYADLPTLVDGLVQERIPGHALGGESADVRARLPEILAVYQSVQKNRRLS